MLIKLIWLGFFFSADRCGALVDLTRARSLYLNAANSEADCRALLALTSGAAEQSDPVMAGYHGAAMMIMAKYCLNPFRKWRWYTEGRETLEREIQAFGGNPELHFIRFSIQISAPRFLGYHGDLATDRACLENFDRQGSNDQLRAIVRQLLKKAASLGD